ncbi:MAG TPA: carboxypeptidase-like regulatory domain-containing protein [Ignavibacteriaceae bacterium]|jgi:hypothetical protein|nr:MAG: hypothetical protein B6D44_02490 [Ignavibacteriales bacterium UTCHB2]HQF41594.1 carboxypeptidase-like regulatory domain-containing protein [Ignavibacteriaceae bacterium]HQI40744.1 carboxypeptidase-like regulatory domain-containing protein [Ignavibacteriaceae bacterium]HQJ46266.1 carboxypeptidase-like regulatory domain-containing protein [Ignavibacteriaceae bacterium]
MKNLFSLLFLIFCITFINAQENKNSDFILISGIVTDFDNNPIDSAFVEIKYSDFSTAYKTYSDKNGYYEIQIKKGKYLALASMKLAEYPSANSTLPKEKQKLEFWCWNLVADEDLTINIRYNRLEIYGVNVFRIQGATPGYTIYCRPISLTRFFSGPDEDLSQIDLCPNPDELSVKVKINGNYVNVNMKEKVREYVPEGSLFGYLIHVDLPNQLNEKTYDIMEIEMLDIKTKDKGEAFYFIEKENYE